MARDLRAKKGESLASQIEVGEDGGRSRLFDTNRTVSMSLSGSLQLRLKNAALHGGLQSSPCSTTTHIARFVDKMVPIVLSEAHHIHLGREPAHPGAPVFANPRVASSIISASLSIAARLCLS
ncbi:hypothetical protein LMH87_004731 [Akanthomyces muscarius]|uniref:Uncharacterized protein n=1 Tax=Akanthomyces muscarius TaxID=2231603 RepID=A0A9W8Q576_AKAMU|nr:hypothetical protein LMH87_004731 [Akanthomyces muscarius]KAJ4145900.1 hypothetical protein LMH87_004731 [Akanthomyces muscarius]